MPIHDLKPESSLIIVKAESLRLRLRRKSKVTLESHCVAQNVELIQEITYFCLLVCGQGSIVLLLTSTKKIMFSAASIFFFFFSFFVFG